MGNRLARTTAAGLALALCLGAVPAEASTAAVPTASIPAVSIPTVAPAALPAAGVSLPAAKSPLRPLPTSVRSLGVLVNKKHPLKPATYVPKLTTIKGTSFRLRPEAAAAYRKMAAASRKDGIRFTVVSAYRSHARQKQLFAQYTRWYGPAYAARIAARPGRSEHQTGLALDLVAANGRRPLTGSFAATRESKWLVKNAHKYGFILRYPKGQEKTTGYTFEPWHYRYVGKSIAKTMKAKKTKTLEAYYYGP